MSATWMMPESSPGCSSNASFSSFGWPPCCLMGGTSPRGPGCRARSNTGWPVRRNSRAWCSSAPVRTPVAHARRLFNTIARHGPAARSSPQSPCGGLPRSLRPCCPRASSSPPRATPRPRDRPRPKVPVLGDEIEPGVDVGRAVGLDLTPRPAAGRFPRRYPARSTTTFCLLARLFDERGG